MCPRQLQTLMRGLKATFINILGVFVHVKLKPGLLVHVIVNIARFIGFQLYQSVSRRMVLTHLLALTIHLEFGISEPLYILRLMGVLAPSLCK